MIEYLLLASGGHWWGPGPGQSAPRPASCLPASVRPRAAPPGTGVSAMGPQPFLSSPHPLQRATALGVPILGLCRAPPIEKHRGLLESCQETVPSHPGAKGHFQGVTRIVFVHPRRVCPGKGVELCDTRRHGTHTSGTRGPSAVALPGPVVRVCRNWSLRPTVPPGVRGRPHTSRPPASSLFLPDPARGQARKSRPPPPRLGEVP